MVIDKIASFLALIDESFDSVAYDTVIEKPPAEAISALVISCWKRNYKMKQTVYFFRFMSSVLVIFFVKIYYSQKNKMIL